MRAHVLLLTSAVLCGYITLANASPAIAQISNAPDLSLVGAAFDDNRARLVVVGSKSPTATNAETWEWNGSTWLLASTSGPSPRVEPMLTYDSKRKRVLLFGGDRGQQTPLTDTWAWDGTTWKQLAADGPSPRASSMVYDSKRDRVVLFGGGSNTGALFNDTWEFDGATWSRVVNDSAPGNPPARALHGFAYDQRRGRAVITGGIGGFNTVTRTPTTLNDTWEWDGRAWHQFDIAGPGARDHIAMTFVPERGGIVLHGGGNPSTGLQGDSWFYNGSAWTRILENGPPRGRHRLAYDSKVRALLLFGGWAPENRQMTELWSLRADNVWMRISGQNP